MTVTATWLPNATPVEDTIESRAVAALAASLALPFLDTEAATQLAETEGLVTHLTSLVLVDDDSFIQEGIPATRKVLLPTPRTAHLQMSYARVEESYYHSVRGFRMAPTESTDENSPSDLSTDDPLAALAALLNKSSAPADQKAGRIFLSEIGEKIDWDLAPQRLQAGDLSQLNNDTALAIRDLALAPQVQALAQQLGLDPILLAIGLIARAMSATNRSAARIAKAIIGDRLTDELYALIKLALATPNA
jgi:hypothetical protein